jgi:hypothetical protein
LLQRRTAGDYSPLLAAANSANVLTVRRSRSFVMSEAVKLAFRWACLVRRERGVVAIEGRAIGANILDVITHVAEDVRMVLWWQRTHAHEFLGADLDDWNAKVIMEMRNDLVRHANVHR